MDLLCRCTGSIEFGKDGEDIVITVRHLVIGEIAKQCEDLATEEDGLCDMCREVPVTTMRIAKAMEVT